MMIYFSCNNPDCNNWIKKFFKNSKDIPPFLDCGSCGTGKMERQLSAPSSKSTQIIDNGLQARKIEISNSIIQKERKRLQEDD